MANDWFDDYAEEADDIQEKKRHDYTTTRTSNRWVGVLDPRIPFKQTIRELHRSGWKANVEG